MRFVLIFLALLLAHPAQANKAQWEARFQTWVAGPLMRDARKAGVSDAVFQSAMKGVRPDWNLPDLAPLQSSAQSQSQAEFRAPSAYFKEGNLRSQAATGRQLAKKYAGTLKRIEARYGVPRGILLSIWARESGFGRAKIPHNAVRTLATKAFMSTRKELFYPEIIAALQMLERGEASMSQMKSSWAGAMGQPQFLPTSYLKFAVDFDGDGRRDIWSSVPDTLASIANYLAKNGWQKGRDWGFEAVIPTTVSCAQEGPDLAKKIRDWEKLGIVRVSGKAFPKSERGKAGMMLVPAGRAGPHFVVTPNFYVIKEYNNSDLYALFVGNLADRITYGTGAFRAGWPAQPRMMRSDIATMQKRLIAKGHDVGGADGLPGFKTRRSVGRWEERNGRVSTCFPTPQLIRAIR